MAQLERRYWRRCAFFVFIMYMFYHYTTLSASSMHTKCLVWMTAQPDRCLHIGLNWEDFMWQVTNHSNQTLLGISTVCKREYGFDQTHERRQFQTWKHILNIPVNYTPSRQVLTHNVPQTASRTILFTTLTLTCAKVTFAPDTQSQTEVSDI